MSLLFKKHHRGLIQKKKKTVTRRDWKKQRVNVGSHQRAKTEMLSTEFFALLHIDKVYKQKLCDMTEEDAQKEGEYTLAEYKEEYKRIYGSWDDSFEAWVVEFHIVGKPYHCFECKKVIGVDFGYSEIFKEPKKIICKKCKERHSLKGWL